MPYSGFHERNRPLDETVAELKGQLAAVPHAPAVLDVSVAMQWRPFMTQNVVLNASAAALLPGKGLKQLYDEDQRGPQYSILVNLLLNF